MLKALRSSLAGWIQPKQADAGPVSGVFGSAMSLSGAPSRGTQAVLAAYRNMPWLHAITHRIAESVASTQWQLFVADSSGRAERRGTIQRAGWRRRHAEIPRLKQAGELRELEAHPMLDLLEMGNGIMSGHSVMQIAQTHLDLKGEAFLLMGDNGLGAPSALWPLPPHWVKDTPEPSRPSFSVAFRGPQVDIPAEQILWVKDPDPENPYGRGSGFAEALGDELDTDEYAAKMIKGFFWNGGMPSAIVGFEGASDDAVRKAEQRWRDEHASPHKKNRVKFTNQVPKVEVLDASFKDSDVVALRQFERDTIQQVFGVPPEILGIITNSNRATIEASDFLYARWTLIPRLERLRIALQNQLLPRFDDRLILDYESPLPADKQFELELLKAAPWAKTRAEVRDLSGLESHGDVDDVYMQPIALTERPVEGDAPVAQEPETPEDAEPIPDAFRSKAPSAADIEAALGAFDDLAKRDELSKLWGKRFKQVGDRELAQISQGLALDMNRTAIANHLREFAGERLDQINASTKNKLRKSLAQGVARGESVEQLGKRTARIFDEVGESRARAIARTEVNRSANAAILQAQRIAGVQFRQWVVVPDGDRHHSLGLNGIIAPMGEPFVTPVGIAMHPGEFGDPAQDVNCRCTVVPVETQRRLGAAREKQAFDDFADGVAPWEREAETAFRGMFREQKRSMAEAVELLK